MTLNSIKAKLLLALLAFGLIPFVVISVLSIRTIKNELKEEILSKLALFADARTDDLFSYFDLIETRTRDFASDGIIQNSLKEIQRTGSQTEIEAINRYILEGKKNLDRTLLDVLLLDAEGQIIAAHRKDQRGQFYSDALYFEKGRKDIFITKTQDPVWTDGRDAFLVAIPVKEHRTQQLLGVLVNLFDTTQLETLLAGQLGFDPQGNRLLGASSLQTLEVYLVDGHGKMFVRPLRLIEARKSPQDIQVQSLPVEECVNERRPVNGAIYRNYENLEVIGVSVCFPEKDWVVLSEVTVEEAFLPLTKVYLRLGFTIALFFLTILLFALVLSRKVSEPLKTLLGAVKKVEEGELEAKVDFKSNDEIGHLARVFNEMTQKLKISYGSLEKKVREKTKALHDKILKIQQEKAKDEAMLQSIADGVIMTDSKGKILIVNPAAQMILGWSLKDVQGKNLPLILKLEDDKENPLPKEKQPLSLALTDLKKIAGVYYYGDKNQTKFPISIHISPVKLDKKVMGAIMILRDVTREKEVERMKDEFVSLVSHQMRTPLSGMKWFMEILRTGDVGPLNPEQREFVEDISELNERMIALVNALLNIARIESGRIIIEPEPTDLKALVREVMKAFEKKIQQKNISLIVSINDKLPIIKVDTKLVREVYSNLLSNAIKYTPPGNEITLFISEKDDEVMTQISDTGYGIPSKEQSKVFRKFFRGSNIAAVETDGNGLGLYLVRAIVESSGGRIWFKSVEGEGTTFFFTLPKKGMKPKKGQVRYNTIK